MMTMSESAEGQSHEDYSSQIDPAFSRAFNEVFHPEDTEKAGQGAGTPPEGGEGEAAPATPVVTPGQQPAEAAGAGAGEAAPATTEPANAGQLPGSQGATEGAATGVSTPVPNPWGGAPRPYADVAPLFDTASKQLIESSEAALREAAIQEIRKDIDPSIIQAINSPPRLLIGDTVPSIKAGGEPEVIKSSEDAKDWQDAVRQVISAQIATRTEALMGEARPVLSTLQDSVSLFRNNKDLVPGTNEFNPELVRRFITMAGAYIHRIDGKAVGFRVDVQPLIDSIRDELGTTAPAPTARQEQVAGQARTPEGRFDAPQAGIPSTSGLSGVEEESYDAFWKTLNMPTMNI